MGVSGILKNRAGEANPVTGIIDKGSPLSSVWVDQYFVHLVSVSPTRSLTDNDILGCYVISQLDALGSIPGKTIVYE